MKRVNSKESLEDAANRALKLRFEQYSSDPKRIVEDYNNELKNIEAYNGRQLLEMLQNADDAATLPGTKSALIRLRGKQLVIANNGVPFSPAGLDSILYSDLSSKFNSLNQIGNKGLGFRSVLSWADKVTIQSAGLRISFSRENSISFLQRLIKEDKSIGKILKEKSDQKFPIATLRCPLIEKELQQDADLNYTTLVIIDLKPSVLKDVQRQINAEIDKEIILFLNNLEKIIVESPERTDQIQKTVESSNRIRVDKVSFEGKILETKTWSIKGISGEMESSSESGKVKRFHLKCAWTNALDDQKNLLYSFFKTQVRFVFPALIHGTFELSANRNNLEEDTHGFNLRLFAKLAELLIETALQIAKTEINDPYFPLKLLCIENAEWDPVIVKSGFKGMLVEKIKQSALFPNIAGEYINWEANPVFYERRYAELLAGQDLKNLLQFTEDKKVIKLFSQLNIFHYKTHWILKIISKASTEINCDAYSQLIYSVVQDYEINGKYTPSISSQALMDSPPVFYGSGMSQLSPSAPIFLPPDGKMFDIPSNIGVQFVDEELTKHLRKVFGRTRNELLANDLACFHIKPYQFMEIVRMLVNHFDKTEKGNTGIQLLHQTLFKLYCAEISNLGEIKKIPTDLVINILNRQGKKQRVTDLYFGAGYDNELTESLYRFDKNRFVCGPARLGIEVNPQVLKKYLTWLGVADRPRSIQISPPPEYTEYCLRQLDFKKPVAGYKHFSDFSQLSENFNRNPTATVRNYDGLDSILRECEPETILAWVESEEKLKRNLQKDEEESDSQVNLDLYRTREYKIVDGRDMKSYLRWRISTIAWIPTKSGRKAEPDICSLSKTISEDFSPFIEIPAINSDSPILSAHRIKPDALESLLLIVGVHKTIASMRTASLYKILLRLPEIDKNGKIASILYREIVSNYDERKIDRKDPSYLEYMESGKVFYKRKDQFGYLDRNTVFYVPNKLYGENIINHFDTIPIERRRNRAKIKIIFGVNTLQQLKVSLEGIPAPHSLNLVFSEEIEHFKPYVFALRRAVDTEGKDRVRIKTTRFVLVTSMQARLEQAGEEHVLKIVDFEFLYFQRKSELYIQVPEDFGNLEDLRRDFRFCEVIAEAFSALFDVDAQKQTIRELFSHDHQGRDEILRADLDDQKLEKLADARVQLNIVHDSRLQFWKSVANCFQKRALKLSISTDELLLREITQLFPELGGNVGEYLEKINYSSLNQEGSLESISKLFSTLKIDANQFNQYSVQELDFRRLYKVNFQEVKLQFVDGFRKLLYHRLLTATFQEKEKYDTLVQSYKQLQLEFKNSVHFDVEFELKSIVLERFGIDLQQTDLVIDLQEIDRARRIEFSDLVADFNCTKVQLERFLGEYTSASLLLFGEFVELANRLKQWLNIENKDRDPNKPYVPNKKLTIGGSLILFDDYTELHNQLHGQNNLFDIKIERIRLGEANSTKPGTKVSNVAKTRQRTAFGLPNSFKEELGFVGEFIVYQNLLTAEKNVKWVSENARRAGIDRDADSGQGYDLTYVNRFGKTKYVEVKVVGDDNAFYISGTEIRVGEELKNHYEIFLVRNPQDSNRLRLQKIVNLFDYKPGQNFHSNENFSVSTDTYILKFNEQLSNSK